MIYDEIAQRRRWPRGSNADEREEERAD